MGQTFVIGDFVRNFPMGKERSEVFVDGVVAAVMSDGSPEIAGMHDGDYVRFVASAAKTEKRSA